MLNIKRSAENMWKCIFIKNLSVESVHNFIQRNLKPYYTNGSVVVCNKLGDYQIS